MATAAGTVSKAESRLAIGAESGAPGPGNASIAAGIVDNAGATIPTAGSRDDTAIVNGSGAPRSGAGAEATALIAWNQRNREPPLSPRCNPKPDLAAPCKQCAGTPAVPDELTLVVMQAAFITIGTRNLKAAARMSRTFSDFFCGRNSGQWQSVKITDHDVWDGLHAGGRTEDGLFSTKMCVPLAGRMVYACPLP